MRCRYLLLIACLLVSAGCESAPPGPSFGQPPSIQPLSMTVPRAAHRATVLNDGRVLLTGGCTRAGCGGFDAAARSELFDPGSGRFVPGPAMASPRAGHTASLLPDGRVLVAGGYPGEGRAPLATAEIYDPATNAFSPAPPMRQARAEHTATPLPDGRIVIAGGTGAAGSRLSTTELFDPGSGTFRAGSPLSAPRAAHVAVATGDRIVLIGGSGPGSDALPTTDTYDGRVWTPGPNLATGRVKHAAAALTGRRILVIGGATSRESRHRLDSTEIVDLPAGRTVAGPRLPEPVYKIETSVATLPDGRVAIAGGRRLAVFDPRRHAVAPVGEHLGEPLSAATVSLVGAGGVLVTGGYDATVTPTAAARVLPL